MNLNKVVFVLLSLTIVSCFDLSSITQTEYFTVTSKHLSMIENEEENNYIVDTLQINKTLAKPSTDKIWELSNFKCITPINYTLNETTSGVFKISLGDALITNDDPDFFRIEIEDTNVEDMVFQDYSNFFYINTDKGSITIKKIIQGLQSSAKQNKIFYSDDKSFVIYGDSRNFNVIHLNYLEELRKMEVFINYQKSGPFSDLSSRDLFTLALSKLRMARNFHIVKSIDEEENWSHITSTLTRYHRKLANLAFETIKSTSKEIAPEKNIEINVPDFDMKINVYRGEKVDTIQQDFKKLKISKTIDLRLNTFFQNATTKLLSTTYTGSELKLLQKETNTFIIGDDQRKRLFCFYNIDNTPILIRVTDEYEYSDSDDNLDLYFEMFKKLEKGFDTFY
ncbi:hypothetical protein [Aquimarina algiphila]|uniref:Uncharacterized protein n=1 Tax=Aquimarina algiphila TaxID=2047982 RepID=A0A554VBY4_9FLAO|nr:hypothetical protein [Aquimarina algiphila]TSE04125.1 hypothetical protein FOF46_27440 [Aquimarina algiphila]